MLFQSWPELNLGTIVDCSTHRYDIRLHPFHFPHDIRWFSVYHCFNIWFVKFSTKNKCRDHCLICFVLRKKLFGWYHAEIRYIIDKKQQTNLATLYLQRAYGIWLSATGNICVLHMAMLFRHFF